MPLSEVGYMDERRFVRASAHIFNLAGRGYAYWLHGDPCSPAPVAILRAIEWDLTDVASVVTRIMA
jgi:hypothetical protein